MAPVVQAKHRAGALKQTNKSHKTGRHRSKGSISGAMHGKVDVKALTKHARKELNKNDRRHQTRQLRQQKRSEVIALKRNFGSSSAPPILITIIPLNRKVNVASIVSLITSANDLAGDSAIKVANSPQGNVQFSVPRFKQRYTILQPQVDDLLTTLDAVKVSTTVLFIVSVEEGSTGVQADFLDDWGEEVIGACLSQRLPTTITAIANLESLPVKKRQAIKQKAQDLISRWLPEEKILTLDKSADALNLLRKVGSQKQTDVAYRNKRPHLLAEEIEYTSNTLKVSGYLRGLPLSVNGLVHIPGFGDFQMSKIVAVTDPYTIPKEQHGEEKEIPIVTEILAEADPTIQESLDSENVPDLMDAEQTWPTEEDMAEAKEEMKKKKIVKIVPKGTSEYQAAWIPDEEGEFEGSDCSDDEDDNDQMSVSDADSDHDKSVHGEDNDEYETLSITDVSPNEQQYDEQLDLAEERRAMEKIKEAKLDAEFPDEVDTPVDTLAKLRFAKYRGLESFRTSPWDPKANLPVDYSRIFQFANFDRTRRRIFKECQDDGDTLPGRYVTLYIKNVQSEIFDAYQSLGGRSLIVFGLLPNEHKMSLVNIKLKRTNNLNNLPIASKERLIFQCGFRRFSACPIFSQHTNSSKHKYVRFFQPEDTVVASMYAPITFPPCPVLCWKEMDTGALELVATGNVYSVDPNRLVIKRAVLSGHPFKVHKRSAVIRFMFYNREDIMWFKPVQLHTKYGRRGHIREPLGTHGHMKCIFDGQLKSQDTILMNLYKRIFPKWTYKPLLITSV